ncbi:Ger(x)C family spore germination protein [Gottfriedia luciferensis]|uniref:Ger(x)C family spore germination protein n=1 Tax=Gottfriedia luciferensis TaxID=178774 RepID=UPI000B44A2ED|nr:Ger(x)C family spore germination protein [Gottfriedia luciferensis]
MKCIIGILLIFALCFMSGCQLVDVDKRFFVVSIGIDKADDDDTNKYIVSLKLAIPSAQIEPGKSDFQIISQSSTSVTDAIRIIQSLVDKKLDFGQCRVLLIGKQLLGDNQIDLMNWFIKRPDIQGIAYVGVGEPSAKDVLSWKVKSERLPGNALVLTFNEEANKSPYIMSEILNDYYMRLNEEGIDPYLPIIQPIENTFKINTSAVFKGTKFKAELNPDETRLLNELINPEKTNIINVGKGKNQFSINAEKTKTDMKIVIPKNKKPYVDVHIKIKGVIEESKKTLHKIGQLKEYENKTSKLINLRTKRFLEHLQDLDVDPHGLGLNYQAKYGMSKKEINKWKQIYPKIEFRVKSEVILKATGTMY